MKKYFIYTRKSTDSEDRQVLSIEAQIAELELFIRTIGEDVFVVDLFTESRTAKDPGRPIFNKMLSRIENGEAEGIISWHPDRLARNSIDGGKIIYFIDKGLIKYIDFPTYRFDNTSQGKFMLSIIFGQSKYYVDNLSENVKRGIRQKLRRGEWTSLAPIGYINNHITRTLEPDPVYAPKIKNLFEFFLTGKYTLNHLTYYAHSIGLIAKKSGNPLSKSTMSKLLSNTTYCGLMKYKGEIYEGKYKTIVSRETFYKVQDILKARTKAKPRKDKQNRFIFTGLMRCSLCGSMITAEFQKARVYYRCTKKSGKCNLKYLREDYLVEQINKILKKVTLDSNLIEYLKKKIMEEKNNQVNLLRNDVSKIKEKLENIDISIDKLMDLYLENRISKAENLKKREKLFNDRYFMQKELTNIQHGNILWIKIFEEFVNNLYLSNNALESNNLEEKRAFLQKIGINFILKPKANISMADKYKAKNIIFECNFKGFWEQIEQIKIESNNILDNQEKWQLVVNKAKEIFQDFRLQKH